jgi:integrase
VRRGEYRTLSKVSFEEYAREWIEQYGGRTKRGIRDATRDDYRRTLEQLAIPFFGRMRLTEIEPRDIKRYASSVAATGKAANTVRLALAPVKALLATAAEEGILRSNPSSGVRLAYRTEDTSEASVVKALTERELQQLLDELPAEWLLLVRFLAHTGTRISEALALSWEDVDFGNRRILIRRRLYRGKIGPTKTDYGRRRLRISNELAQSLWVARRSGTGIAPDSALVFASPRGEPLNRSRVFKVVRAAGKRTGVPWIGLHTLRHTCATTLFRHGWNAKQVQMFLGHHSPAFTLCTYVHLLPDDLPEPDFDSWLAASGTASDGAEQGQRKGQPEPPGSTEIVPLVVGR